MYLLFGDILVQALTHALRKVAYLFSICIFCDTALNISYLCLEASGLVGVKEYISVRLFSPADTFYYPLLYKFFDAFSSYLYKHVAPPLCGDSHVATCGRFPPPRASSVLFFLVMRWKILTFVSRFMF